jgi:two-component system chemotaxis response regulator CheB
MTAHSAPLRVVVTDDSGLMRRVLSDGLTKLGFVVVGEARSGGEALDVCARVQPDVLTLDLTMPGLDGIGVMRALEASGSSIPVVVVSAFSNGMRAVDALAEGAVELVAKPAVGEPLSGFLGELGDKLRVAAGARRNGAVSHGERATAPVAGGRMVAGTRNGPRGRSATKRAVVIACSTGGPKALGDLVPDLPARLGEGTLIVQHMPAGFTASLAERLDRVSRLSVEEAKAGQRIAPASALIAPGGSHLRLTEGAEVRLSDEAPIGGLRPRADLTISDSARVYGERLLLVVLTGMGRDGLEGARDVKQRGGRIVCEAESSCVVYGMPRAVVEAKLADHVLPLPEIAAAIASEAG